MYKWVEQIVQNLKLFLVSGTCTNWLDKQGILSIPLYNIAPKFGSKLEFREFIYLKKLILRTVGTMYTVFEV